MQIVEKLVICSSDLLSIDQMYFLLSMHERDVTYILKFLYVYS